MIADDGFAWHNFRDMGLTPIGPGHRLRRGVLYRAGAVTAQGSGAQPFKPIPIDTICDLRHDDERIRQPTPWRKLGARNYWFRAHGEQTGDLRRILEDPGVLPAQTHTYMVGLYERLPFTLVESYRAVFNRLATARTPLVFHCTAGKDRTGVLAALILASLGADRGAIEADYLGADADASLRLASLLRLPQTMQAGHALGLVPVLRADPDYLNAMFGAIEEQAGGIEAYFHDHLAVTGRARAAIRTHLIERA